MSLNKYKTSSSHKKIGNVKFDNSYFLIVEPKVKINFPKKLNLRQIRKQEEQFQNLVDQLDQSSSYSIERQKIKIISLFHYFFRSFLIGIDKSYNIQEKLKQYTSFRSDHDSDQSSIIRGPSILSKKKESPRVLSPILPQQKHLKKTNKFFFQPFQKKEDAYGLRGQVFDDLSINETSQRILTERKEEKLQGGATISRSKRFYMYDSEDDDKTPQDWIAQYKDTKGPHAQVLHFNIKDKSYKWTDCNVLSYDEQTKKYLIQIYPNGQKKEIKRLSIKFNNQNQENFETRIVKCRQKDLSAQEEQRFITYVNSISVKKVNLFSTNFKTNLIAKLKQSIKYRFMLICNDRCEQIRTILNGLIKEAEELHIHLQKKGIVYTEMKQNPRKFQSLEINLRSKPDLHQKKIILSQRSSKPPKILYLQPNILNILREFEEKAQSVEFQNMFKLKIQQDLPLHFNTFNTMIYLKNLDAQDYLINSFRKRFITIISNALDDKYKYHYLIINLRLLESDNTRYQNTELYKVINILENKFSLQLQRIVYFNFQEYINLLEYFNYSQNCKNLISKKPLFKIQLKGRFKKKKTKKQSISDEEELIFYEPSLKQIEEILCQQFYNIQSNIQMISKLDSDLLPLMLIKHQPALIIDFNIFQYGQYLEKLKTIIEQEIEQLNSILLQYADYSYLLQEDQQVQIIKKILGKNEKEKMVDIEYARKQMVELETNLENIQKLKNQTNRAGLFEVSINYLYEVIISSSKLFKKDLEKKLQKHIQQCIFNLKEKYEKMYYEISKSPQNEQELLNQKEYHSNKVVILQELQLEKSKISKLIDFCEQFYFLIEYETIQEFMYLHPWYKEIMDQSQIEYLSLQEKEFRFCSILEADKKQFEKKLIVILDHLRIIKQFSDYKQQKESYEEIKKIDNLFQECIDLTAQFNKKEKLLLLPFSNYQDLQIYYNDFQPYYQLWNLTEDFDEEKDKIMNCPIMKLSYQQTLSKLMKYIKETLRLSQIFEEVPLPLSVTRQFRRDIDELKEKLWIVEYLTIEAYIKKPSNWKEFFQTLQIKPNDSNSSITVKFLIEGGVLNQKEKVEYLSKKADKCWNIEKKLKEIYEKVREIKIDILPYKKTGTYIFRVSDEVSQILDEQLNTIMMIKVSPYVKGVLQRTNWLENRIVLLQDSLENGIKCQRSWMYLEPIFDSDDIKSKLALEKKKFDSVDKNRRSLMEIFKREQYLWDAVETDKIKTEFELSNRILAQISKSLSDYLEIKRKYFPRFYFLSDEELLEILAQTKDPNTVQKHVGKCFEGIDYLEFNKKMQIIAMRSAEQESIKLINKVDVNEGNKKGNVELWLSEVESSMKLTMKSVTFDTLKDQLENLLKWPGQSLSIVNLILWTKKTEEAIRKQKLRKLFDQWNEKLITTVELLRNDLKNIHRINLSSLVVLDVHAKDILHRLQDCKSIHEFQWISELRYYVEYEQETIAGQQIERLDKPINILLKMVNSSISYQFEYLGTTGRLVITPLTDRCYRTLIGGFYLNYGGAPEGPAGTGKTETVKDLSKAIGVKCVVFNCSNSLNFIAMRKFFKALSQTGSWCSFDEFNRIDPDVLSVVAQQIFTIYNAKKLQKTTFFFDDDDITLIDSCAINITMNPGYQGRSELPDNLKVLFRPCAMMVPDYAMIAEIYLYSVGFHKARELSIKFVASLKLCTEQLSSQDHYDFGMRELKSILTNAGLLKRILVDLSEEDICLKALTGINLPKLTMNDTPLFNQIINDLFPDIAIRDLDNSNLKKELKDYCQANNLHEKIIFKCLQLNDTFQVRHGLMCVGQAFSGKSKVIEVLSKALKTVQIFKMNPKSITLDQLYGKLDPDTKQWSDGIASILIRNCVVDESSDQKWIIFDGPVDAIWIENMNTVLDDNKKLCLSSGEIIKLNQTINILFEVQDLSAASPSTVSRCGMVYFEPKQLGWKLLIETFDVETDKAFISEILSESLNWVQEKGCFPVMDCEMSLVNTMLNLLRGMEKKGRQEIIFCLIWSIGGALDISSRKQFGFFLQKFSGAPKNPFDVVIIEDDWVKWVDIKEAQQIDKSLSYHDLFIETRESIRNDYFIEYAINNRIHYLFCGSTGTSKTSNIVKKLKNYYYMATGFSGQTTANQIQRTIESKVNVRRRKGHYGPEAGQGYIVIFIDDLNMVNKEEYGAQPAIELLRQWMDMGGWYDLDSNEWKYLCDIIFIVAMQPRNLMTRRYLRHFGLMYLGAFEKESLKRIYNQILSWYYMGTQDWGQELNNQIVEGTVRMYKEIQTLLLPIPAKSHYIYNLRDISKIFLGISKAREVSGSKQLIQLWAHECQRQFSDRMINNQDIKIYQQLLERIMKQTWNLSLQTDQIWVIIYIYIYKYITIQTDIQSPNKYKIVESQQDLQLTCQKYLDDHNYSCISARMTLVLFFNAIQHICRIVRILQTDLGHALLVGMGGTGRSSLARLAIYIVINTQPQILDSKNFNEDLQKIMRIAGIDNRKTVILFNDTQIINESILEDLSNLINNGEIPNLISPEEKQKIIEDIDLKDANSNQKYQRFVHLCKKNIHFILCMQPVGELFRKRIRTFPILINNTTIDWFQEWPQEALYSTSISQLQALPEINILDKELLSTFAVKIHQKASNLTLQYYQEFRKYFYVTPTQYLQLLSTFIRFFTNQKEHIRIQIDRYETGIEKINATENDVAQMKEKLFALQPQLQKLTQENLVTLQHLQKKSDEAEEMKLQREQEEKECNVKRDIANTLKEECQSELNNVLPLLAQAAEALEKITKDDMTQLKSFANPPPSACVVMEGVCIIFQADVKGKNKEAPNTQDYWEYSKKYVLNDKLIKKIKDFKVEQIRQIPMVNIQKLKQFSANPLFDKDKVFNASKAAGNLSLWVRAVLETYDAILIIEPKKEQLAEAQNSLLIAEEQVLQKQKALEEALDYVKQLQMEYEIKKKEKEQIQSQVDDVQAQLTRAEKLTNGLANEKASWILKAKDYTEQQQSILGNCMLCSAIISYMGVFPQSYRVNAIHYLMQERRIQFSQNFSIQHLLCDPLTISDWTNNQNLPNDSLSIENAIILKNSSRWPLMIDPQLQAISWIKSIEQNIITTSNEYQLENAISIGYAVLIEVGESIDPLYEPVLQLKIIQEGSSSKMKLGDKTINYSKDFRFYMITKLANPHYQPQVCVMVTMLNFEVTLEGLEDQMLNIVVKMDEPQKEEQRKLNMQKFFQYKSRQQITEDLILKFLYEAKGDLLKDEALIEALNQSKEESGEIDIKLKEQENDTKFFNKIRENYKDVSKRISNLYFVILDLSQVEHTYYWSLAFYIKLFQRSIRESSHSKETRSKNIFQKFQMILYTTISRSLLEKHKFLFSTLICLKIMQIEEKITINQIRFCMLGATQTSTNHPKPEYLTSQQWIQITELSDTFPNEFKFLLSTDLRQPQISLNYFHQAILTKILQPDKFLQALSKMIQHELGKFYLEPPPFNLETLYKESDPYKPLIFIVSPGTDPLHEVQNLARQQDFESNLVVISLGQGQGEYASKQIKNGSLDGKWIVLQNCHVAGQFMNQLEQQFDQILQREVHKDFRLWLTSLPTKVFPHNILLQGIKMTYEPPRGIKNNLIRVYRNDDDYPKPEFNKMQFALAYFHANILERKKYGPLGWNIPYSFSKADYEISKQQIRIFLDSYESIPWQALNYLIAEINYGGRVTDPQDRKLMKILLQDYLQPCILEAKYTFYTNYYIPTDNQSEYISNLPINDPPGFFGLHSNAEIYSAILENKNLSSLVLGLLPRNTDISSPQPEDIVKQKSKQILEQIPELLDERFQPQSQFMIVYLIQEIQRFNRLLQTVKDSLHQLIKGIDGLIVMTSELEELFNNVFNNQVNTSWAKVSYPSIKPLGSWISDLIKRIEFIRSWMENGPPQSFWVGGFFFTQSFLTGILQFHARKHKIPIDQLIFSFSFLEEILDIDDGCLVHGIYLDGAKLEDGKLVEAEDKVLFYKSPLIQFIPCTSKPDILVYECPLYKTQERQGSLSSAGHSTNYVLSIDIPSDDPNHWTKRGVAMLLDDQNI